METNKRTTARVSMLWEKDKDLQGKTILGCRHIQGTDYALILCRDVHQWIRYYALDCSSFRLVASGIIRSTDTLTDCTSLTTGVNLLTTQNADDEEYSFYLIRPKLDSNAKMLL